ncbi:DUF4232 domain-containing protein [Streptomyces sp. NPDC096205]|uniref:DUF4232 domain-containing protein n=1 Tax=Streptomyces sp. NPDC096205 TaxID=3366081 RepID=UPI0038222149
MVAAVLAATACEPQSAGKADGSRRPSSDRPRTTAAATTAAATPSETASPSQGGDSGAVAACAGSEVSFAASSEDAAGEETRHLLLTLTNAGDRKCTVHHYPQVRVGAHAKEPVKVIEDSDPEELITLAPGEEAHAALLVNGGGMDTYETRTVTLRLQGAELDGTPGEPVEVGLPGVAAFDDGARVTYWTTASGYALDFIMSS